ncbi:unnamed protein product [Caenorhabditis auriculariae]|uniref:ribonuclease H n=1 Tax=Caenorhabditis auriculariae TaxID=2777116 RepID=A0A8S1H5R9_9PELO|nr:unnamed protein product [Caenorhabditis auriculariae]
MAKGGYYAVARGRNVGVYRTWPECQSQVNGFNNARFKKFDTEAEALRFIAENGGTGASVSFSTSSPSESRGPKPGQKRKLPASDLVPQPKKPTPSVCFEDAKVVYTDGACSNNGKGHAKAGWGIYWGDNHEWNAFGAVHGPATNNRGELLAVQKALETAEINEMDKLVIRTDSNLLIKSMEQFMKKWKKNGWKTTSGEPVKNQDLLTSIDDLTKKVKVKFEHVRGHSGVEGNEKADGLLSSVASGSSDESVKTALKWLVEAAKNRPTTSKELSILRNQRKWGSASTVRVAGLAPFKTVSTGKPAKTFTPFVVIRWPEHSDRNMNIILRNSPEMNPYCAEVKAVYYGMVQSVYYGVDHLRILMGNKIVVDVGNGKYKANKQKEIFDVIQKWTATTSTKSSLKVKLQHFTDAKDKIIFSCPTVMNEDQFMKKFQPQVEILGSPASQ